jgi:hypothetical protein
MHGREELRWINRPFHVVIESFEAGSTFTVWLPVCWCDSSAPVVLMRMNVNVSYDDRHDRNVLGVKDFRLTDLSEVPYNPERLVLVGLVWPHGNLGNTRLFVSDTDEHPAFHLGVKDSPRRIMGMAAKSTAAKSKAAKSTKTKTAAAAPAAPKSTKAKTGAAKSTKAKTGAAKAAKAPAAKKPAAKGK